MNLNKIIIITFLILLINSACQQNIDNKMVKWKGPDDKQDIVCYFKKGTNTDEINNFSNNVIGYPHSEGKGYHHLQGIQGIESITTQEYNGFTIELTKNATEEERKNTLNAINSSPLIYKVFENVVPNEIILDPIKAKEEKEKAINANQDNRPPKKVVIINSTEN